jgi:hypothetical protein
MTLPTPSLQQDPANHALDAALPGMATALNVERMLELLCRHVPEIGPEVELHDGRILEVQYRAGSECLVSYRLKVRARPDGRTRSCDVHARVLGAAERPLGLSEQVRERFSALGQSPLRTPYVLLPAQGLEVFVHPADPVLVQLVEAMDPKYMRSAFSELWRHRNVHVRRVLPTLLAYVPHSRATLLYEVLSESADAKIPELRRVVGKLNVSKPSGQLFAFAWSVWRAAKQRIPLAPPIGHIGALNMTLQEHVRGTRLGELVTEPEFMKLMGEAARSLHVLHGLRVPPRSVRAAPRIVEGVERWAGMVASLLPDRAQQVRGLQEVLAGQIPARMKLSGLVHGDFHPANLLVQDGEVTIIDLDQMSLSDPLIDVGRFRAALRVSALRAFGDASALERPAERLLERYIQHSAEDDTRALLFEGASLLTSAATGFRLQRPGWRDSALALCDEAERVIGRATRGPAVALSPASTRHPRYGIEDLADWLTTPHYVQAMLERAVSETYGVDLRRCKIRITEERDASILLKIRLSGRHHGERWGCTLDGLAWRQRSGRGPHARLAALHAQLGESQVLRVPRPVAYVRPLRMQVMETCEGALLDDHIVAGGGEVAAERVAEALHALHGSGVEVDREYPLDREIAVTRRRMRKLRDTHPGEHARMATMLDEAASRASDVTGCRAPVLRTLAPCSLVCEDGRVTPLALEDVRMSHALLDVANLLAKLMAVGAAAGNREPYLRAAGILRARYLQDVAFGETDLAGFEALALVRESALTLRCAGNEVVARALLGDAERVLGHTGREVAE